MRGSRSFAEREKEGRKGGEEARFRRKRSQEKTDCTFDQHRKAQANDEGRGGGGEKKIFSSARRRKARSRLLV